MDSFILVAVILQTELQGKILQTEPEPKPSSAGLSSKIFDGFEKFFCRGMEVEINPYGSYVRGFYFSIKGKDEEAFFGVYPKGSGWTSCHRFYSGTFSNVRGALTTDAEKSLADAFLESTETLKRLFTEKEPKERLEMVLAQYKKTKGKSWEKTFPRILHETSFIAHEERISLELSKDIFKRS